MAAIAQNGATTPTLSDGNQVAASQAGGKPAGLPLLPLHGAAASRTEHALPVANTGKRYAAVGPSTNGLVGWWKFDETEGTLAADSSGNGHNGTLLNGPTWTNGQLRGALSFDGTNDQVTCVDAPGLRISDNMTIAFWTKKKADANQDSFVVGKANSHVRNYVIWSEAGNGRRLLFQQLNAAGQGINLWTTAKLAVGTWYHVAVVVRGNMVSLFVNGKFDGSKTRSIAGPTTTDPLAFGYGGWNDHYAGSLDDVRIYNRALADDEIAGLHSEASPDRRRAGGNPEPPARSQAGEARRVVSSHSRGSAF